jgi:hypothetical protein
MRRSTIWLGVAAGLLLGAEGAAAQVAGHPEPTMLTTQQDHERTMDLLGITALRQGANGSNPEADNYANYDESLATPYPYLPDPLLTNDRRRVTTVEMWWQERRPEIVEFFDREIYGREPAVTPEVRWEVERSWEATLYGIPVHAKQLRGRVDNSAYPLITVEILALLATPAAAAGPVPVITQFGGVNFATDGGGFGAAAVGGAAAGGPPGGGGGGPTGPGLASGPPWQQQLLEKGWGFALLAPNSVQADNGAGLTQGIIGLVNRGQPRSVEDWGALRAWGWGASRLLDYFAADPTVDADQVGITGHSRYGKAAIVAMAYDQRFAIGYISSSGAGGVKLHRRNYGELVENVAASNEYHWMAGNYIKYAGPFTWDDLPVDSHQLVALVAPRPVFIGSGDVGDGWVDAKGMFLAGLHASPVYELLGASGLGGRDFPALETGLLEGEVAFRQHSGGHTPGPNWPAFIEFAGRYLSAPDRR